MKLLVTGGAGYIGSVVVERALERGHEVVALDNLQEGHRAALNGECRLVVGDYGDAGLLDSLLSAEPFDAVVHLAAETTVALSVADPAIYFRNNTVNGLALLDAMRRHRVMRMVFSSTAATYGEPVATPITEDHPQRPINAYGESKLMFERCLGWYHRAYGLRAASFRYFNAAGATATRGEAHRHETHLIPLVLDAATGVRTAIDVYGDDYPTRDGTCVRDFVHVADIAEAHLLALDKLDSLGLDWFNIGTGTGHTVAEVVRTVQEVTGRHVEERRLGRRPGDPATLVACANRIRRTLGWTPQFPTLGNIIETAWAWKERHPRGYDD
jgi:UDP-glucose 4-epimerase